MAARKAKGQASRVLTTEQEFVDVLHELYDWFNGLIFGGELPGAVISLTGPTAGTVPGRFSPGRWRQRGLTVRTDEITLHPELALNLNFPDIAAILAHQMAHQAQEHFPTVYGMPSKRVLLDDSYHPRQWHELMTRGFGLQMPEDRHTSTEGRYGIASVTPRFRAMLRGFPRTPTSWTLRTKDEGPRGLNKWKLWMCFCSTRIRSAVLIDVTCNKCGGKFRAA